MIKVLALGDSLTAGFGLDPEHSFASRLEQELGREGYMVRVINGGVSGDTTWDGLQRLDALLGEQPDIAIVELGPNDFFSGVGAHRIQDNLDKIVRACLESGARVLLSGFLSLQGFDPYYTRSFHEVFPALSRSRGVPLFPDFMPGIPGNPELTLPDRMHPNSRGVDRIVQDILPYLRPLLGMGIVTGNMYDQIPEQMESEVFESILETRHLSLERIISRGHATPKDEWYDQDRDEWVLLLQGQAGLWIRGEETPRHLRAGDYVHLPAHLQHRVEWTSRDPECIWLAVHLGEKSAGI